MKPNPLWTVALAAVAGTVAFLPGCRDHQAGKADTRDLCVRLVDRSIRCLELEVQAGETADFSTKERLALARIHRKGRIRSCRSTLVHDPVLTKDLTACLGHDSCLAYRDCRRSAAVRNRARRVIAALTVKTQDPKEKDKVDPSKACSDHYLLGSLKAQTDPESLDLAKKLHSACASLSVQRTADLKQKLGRALSDRNPHAIAELAKICRAIEDTHKNDKLGPPASSHKRSKGNQALAELCREQWRLRSAINSIRRLRGFLTPPGCAECALRICRYMLAIAPLARSPLAPVRELASRFRRMCKVDTSVFWIQTRLTRKHGVGPATCKRARGLLDRATDFDPLDPTVHLASCLVDRRCAKFSRRRR